jgi:hypothetical protein
VTHRSRSARIRFALLFEAGLGVLGVLLSLLFGHRIPLEIELHGAAVGLLATLPLCGALWLVWRSKLAALRELRTSVRRMVSDYFGHLRLPEAIGLSAVAGIGEELLFRGFLQAFLSTVTGLPLLGLLLAAVAFGAVHFLSPAYFAYATLLGVVLGGSYWLTGSVLAPIICHAAYDSVALMVSQRPEPSAPGSDRSVSPDRDRRPPDG